MSYRGTYSDEVVIKSEAELDCYWVKLSESLQLPAGNDRSEVRCFTAHAWDNMTKSCEKYGQLWYRVAQWKGFTMLHDPRLLKTQTDRDNLKID